MSEEERSEHERYELSLPIKIGTTHGVTRKLDLHGVLFVAPAAFVVGSPIDFSFATTFAGTFAEPATVLCRGTVVRSDLTQDGEFLTDATIEVLRLANPRKPDPSPVVV